MSDGNSGRSNSARRALDVRYWRQALLDLAEEVDREKDRLCQLDGAIGDGDHGTSMAAGFRLVAARLATEDFSDVGAVLHAVGTTLVSSVGGVTGIVFGTFFIGAGKAAKGRTETGTAELADMFAAGLEAVQLRGKAQPGDKTMVDALAPAVHALRHAAERGLSVKEALDLACTSAREGMERTREMKAKVGRARYQGDKAIGHVDAGAASVAIIMASLARTCTEATEQ
jgi:dihydroxyacetone kinase-like protein